MEAKSMNPRQLFLPEYHRIAILYKINNHISVANYSKLT